MPDDFRILPSTALKQAAQSCPLLESDKAKGEWVACCSQRFFPLAKRIAGNDDLAMDVLQTSWQKVLESAHASFEGPTACPWVATIVANSAKDLRRQQIRRKEVPLTEVAEVHDPAQDLETAVQERQHLELLREVIAMLPSAFSQVAELRLQKGLTSAQTAQELNISIANVKTRLHRAKGMIDRIIRARLEQRKPVSRRTPGRPPKPTR